MNPEDQKSLVIEHLRRREQIAEQTRARIQAPERGAEDPLLHVDPEIRRAAEEEYSASIGRRRYVTSDGRVLFLKPEEIAERRRAKARNSQRPADDGSREGERRRMLVKWTFNLVVVSLALAIVWIILR